MNKFFGVSRQERLVDPKIDSTLSYQRNRQTIRGGPKHVSFVDGALINSSSTFGTLLSSQGSGAHHRRASRPGFGATRLTYGLTNPESNPCLFPVVVSLVECHPRSRQPDQLTGRSSRSQTPRSSSSPTPCSCCRVPVKDRNRQPLVVWFPWCRPLQVFPAASRNPPGA